MFATFFDIINSAQYSQVQSGTIRFTIEFGQLSGCEYSVGIRTAKSGRCILVILIKIPDQLWVIVVDIYAGEQYDKLLIVLHKDIGHF